MYFYLYIFPQGVQKESPGLKICSSSNDHLRPTPKLSKSTPASMSQRLLHTVDSL